MKKKTDILKWLLPVLALLANACGYDDLVVSEEKPTEEESTPYVEIRIAVPLANPASTRANPMGGEEGNGRERGILKEDSIHDINVFFYIEQNGLGMDSPDETSIRHIYYNIDDPSDTDNTKNLTVNPKDDKTPHEYWDKRYITLRFACSEEELKRVETSCGINFVAVANLGPVQDISTLGALRNIDLTIYGRNAWSKWKDAFSSNAKDMDYFLMSTAYNDGANKVSVTNSNEKEYSGTTTLQRMYARLDLWYNNSTEDGNNVIADGEKIKELKYKVKNASNSVYITNVLPVNVMQSPSYLFKKVTNTKDTWNADKTIWNKTNLANVESFSWGGKESPKDGPFSSDFNDLPTNYVIERHTLDKRVDGLAENINLDTWYGKTAAQYVAGKTKYNNFDYSIKNTSVGKLSEYYHDKPASEDYSEYGCNHISIISYANENTHPTDCFHSNYLTGMAFRAVYVPETIYSGFSDGKEVAWTATDGTPSNIYRYSPSADGVKENESVYFTNGDAAKAYAVAHPEENAVITEFEAVEHDGKWGFACYYNLWLRHYNNESADPQESYPMEYATVRNNIYRVSVSFSGPGDPEPTMREPDTMKARIFVRKWNMREEKNPLDF